MEAGTTMTRDITEMVDRYRLALRGIWNSYFYADPELRTWESVYSFRALERPLFQALVGDRLDLEPRESVFGPGFQVEPEPGRELPYLQVNQRAPSEPHGGIWEMVKGPFRAEEMELTLLGLFDWSPMAYLDLRYYVVKIERFDRQPEKAGHHALVDVSYSRVVFTSEAEDQTQPR